MQPPDRIAFLASTDLLAQVPSACLDQIAGDLVLREVPAGERLFEEGSVGDEAYLIVEGEMALVSGGVELVRRGPGGVVGEFALIDAEPRSTAGIARTSLTLLCWPRERFLATLAANPSVAQGILRVLTGKLRGDVERRVGLLLEQLRWRQDLERSREIQMGMLPEGTVRTARLEVAGHCAPAGQVGGDFYDVLPFAGGDAGVIILDVTGHGFYSGLFVAMAKSGLHAQAGVDHRPAPVMTAMRRTLSLSLQRHMLMSCAYVLAEPRRGVLHYANAGHPHPLLWRRGSAEVEALEVIDPILGAQDEGEVAFGCLEVPWNPGDVLVLYSDGLIDARDGAGRMFGRGRLEALLAAALAADDGWDAAALCATLAGEVRSWAGPVPAEDDVTLVVMRGLPVEGAPA